MGRTLLLTFCYCRGTITLKTLPLLFISLRWIIRTVSCVLQVQKDATLFLLVCVCVLAPTQCAGPAAVYVLRWAVRAELPLVDLHLNRLHWSSSQPNLLALALINVARRLRIQKEKKLRAYCAV
jgi:hypothetical protein